MMHHHIWLEKPDILKSAQVQLGLRACDVSVPTWNRYAGLHALEPLVPTRLPPLLAHSGTRS